MEQTLEADPFSDVFTVRSGVDSNKMVRIKGNAVPDMMGGTVSVRISILMLAVHPHSSSIEPGDIIGMVGCSVSDSTITSRHWFWTRLEAF